MKKIIIGFIVGALMFGIIPVMAEGELSVTPNPFPVAIDGEVAEVEGYNINGYTFLKLADFGKAGLTVKFNETEGQIEIETKEKAVIMPEPENEPVPEPEKGDDNVSGISRYTENNYEVVLENDVEYYSLKSIFEHIYPEGYNIGYSNNDTAYLMKYKDNIKNVDAATKIFENIPIKYFNGATHIKKTFYLNKIIPLIK